MIGGLAIGERPIGDSPPNVFNDTVSDTVSLSDLISVSVNLAASISDTIGMFDVTSISLNQNATFSDTVGVSDNTSASLTQNATFSDNVIAEDALSISSVYATLFNDAITLSDIFNANPIFPTPTKIIYLRGRVGKNIDLSGTTEQIIRVIGLVETQTNERGKI